MTENGVEQGKEEDIKKKIRWGEVTCCFLFYLIIFVIIIGSISGGLINKDMIDDFGTPLIEIHGENGLAAIAWSIIAMCITIALVPVIFYSWEFIKRERGMIKIRKEFIWEDIELNDFKLIEDSKEKFKFIWDQSEGGKLGFIFGLFLQLICLEAIIIHLICEVYFISLLPVIIFNVIFVPWILIGSVIYMFFKTFTITFDNENGYFELVPRRVNADVIYLERNKIISLEIKFIYEMGKTPRFDFILHPLVGSKITIYKLNALPYERKIRIAKWIGNKMIHVCNDNFIGNDKFFTLY